MEEGGSREGSRGRGSCMPRLRPHRGCRRTVPGDRTPSDETRPRREEHVGAVVNLGEVVPAAPLLGVGQRVGAALVGDGEVALLDVDVGSAVLAHRACRRWARDTIGESDGRN